MADMRRIDKLISDAEVEIRRADSAGSFENERGAALCAIAKSLTAIAIMFNTDYEKTFGGIGSDDQPEQE